MTSVVKESLKPGRAEELQAEISALERQLADFDQRSAVLPFFIRSFYRAFGFGATGKIEWARFKLGFKREELAEFKAQLQSSLTSLSPLQQ